MPPRPPPVPRFQPPANWRAAYRRIDDYQRSLPDQRTCRPSLWIRNLTTEPEARRFHLLIGVMLTARARQTSCAVVMEQLIHDGLTPQRLQSMGEAQLRARLKSINLGDKKARYIAQTVDILLRDYDGKVPRNYDEVLALPGIGPKMANLFSIAADQRMVGLPVDTHVQRIAQRLAWVPPSAKSLEDTRKCLESWMPREYWDGLNFSLVSIGQDFCHARYPKCERCCLRDLCPHAQRFAKK